MRAIPFSAKHLALLLLALSGSASMCLYWSRITHAVHASRASSSLLEPKVLTDFYPSWYAARELLLHHRDPYGPVVNRELQVAYYGKELDPSRPDEHRDQQRFVYPLYFIFFVAPTVKMEFSAVRIILWWVLAAAAVINVLLWLRFLRLRVSIAAMAALLALVLTSIPVMQNLSILQPFLLPACFVGAAVVAIGSGHLFLAGAFLAVATVKPQICLLPLAWFALWTCSNWSRRRFLFWGFAITLAALVLVSEWVLPGWLMRYPGVLRDYAGYTKATSLLGTLLPPPLSWPVATLVLAVVAVSCWRARRQPANSPHFALALSSALTLAVMMIPTLAQPFNHVLLLPVVLLAIRYRRELWQGSVVMRSATLLLCLFTLLPWLLATVAVAMPLTPGQDWLLKVWSLPLAASMALPFAALFMLILLRRLLPLPSTSLDGGTGSTEPTLTAARGHS